MSHSTYGHLCGCHLQALVENTLRHPYQFYQHPYRTSWLSPRRTNARVLLYSVTTCCPTVSRFPFLQEIFSVRRYLSVLNI